MFGKLLSAVTQIVTLPLDVAEAGLDVLDGRKGRLGDQPIVSDLRKMRDEVCEEMEDLDS